jgi:hypothetical protein
MSLASLVKQAVRESIPELTQSLRKSAYEQGWDATAGRGLSVVPDGDGFRLEVSEEAEEAEYGGLGRPPAPAIRRWANDTAQINSAILSAVERKLRGVL